MFRPAAWQAFLAVTEQLVTLQEALAGKDGPAWKVAGESELDSLQKNGTWVVEDAPPDRNIVGSRWLFNISKSTHLPPIPHEACEGWRAKLSNSS